MTITFYCTRCGTCLSVDSPPTSGKVLCINCHCATIVPAPASHPIPVARLADPVNRPSHAPTLAAATLSYSSGGRGDRYEGYRWREAIAERLQNVVDDVSGVDGHNMIACSYCGTTIAKFIKKCPSCRHPLWGI